MTAARRCVFASVLAAAVALLSGASPSFAVGAALPHWTMISQAAPSQFHPGDTADFYEFLIMNDGSANSSGPITFTDILPAGVTVTDVHAENFTTINNQNEEELLCQTTSGAAVKVTCNNSVSAVPIGGTFLVHITAEVPETGISGPLTNTATMGGGGASEDASTSTLTPLVEASQPVPYGSALAPSVVDTTGAPGRQAGSHPFSVTTLATFPVGAVTTFENSCFGFNSQSVPSCPLLNAQPKDIEVSLPAGLVGNPTAWPQCTQAEFERHSFAPCPSETQVGGMFLFFYGTGTLPQYAPIYNIEPSAGQPGELGFSISTLAHVPIFFHVRSDGDYGLTADISNINQFDPVRMAALSIWGNPSDEAHNPQRLGYEICDIGSGGCPSGVANPKPFLSLPTSCTGTSLPVSIGGDSWQNPLFPYPVFDTSAIAGMNGCNQLQFEPTLQARPTTNVADSPSGLHVDIHVPQPESTEGLAEAHLKDTVVTLPKGLTVNPASAAGREGCTPAQFGLTSAEGAEPIRTTADPAGCPDAAKLGTVEVDSPLVDHPLQGSVYLAKPHDNPFKSLLALYIGISDPQTGVVIKLAGKIQIGEDGQLTTTFEEDPQLPFEDFKLDFFGGARAPLRTPATCGEYKTTSELTPWSTPESGPPAAPSDSYLIASGPNGHPCAAVEAALPNAPGFEAGTEAPSAGVYSPFVLKLRREDGSQIFRALNIDLPPGLVGKLAGVGECSDAQLAAAAQKTGAEEQASASCPPGSRIGTVNIGAGAGPAPYYASGTAYLAGPYKGAPLSVAIVTPAVAGPFDLGTVVVRNALHVNPETAQISVTSAPIPTQLQGIQLDIRSIEVKLERNRFTLNPTNCEKMAIGGQEVSSLGNVAALSNPFQVGGCARLGFKPKLAISLKGGTRRTKHPALKAVVTYPSKGAYANIARAQVTLPHSEFLDQSHIGTVCTRVQFAEGSVPGEKCPPASIYGYAKALTPLLDQPVKGPVYLRSSNHKLPDLVAALNGQIDVALDGKVDTGKGGGIRNTFEVVPDAPVSKFTLSMKGGSKGLLINSENICKKPQRALAHLVAQNGKVLDLRPRIANSCGRKRRR